ncbi:MAG TPA: acyl-CoA dehydrogenase family protein [Novosphingobium sp.]|nr:acyl-CoA dehydrogenase family protein [Novosphingobium sp.]
MMVDGNEELELYRDSIRKFLDRECPVDKIATWEREDRVPRELLKSMAELGILGLTVPEEYGGSGTDVLAMAVVMEELGARWNGLAGFYNMSVGYGSLNLVYKASEEQKRRFLPGLLAGETLVAYGLSEPEVGGDLASVRTRMERQGDKVMVTGSKRWISGANMADYMLTLVRSGDPADRHRNLSFVMIPMDAEGVSFEPTRCMGTHGVPTNDVHLDNVVLDQNMVLGEADGWNQGWGMLAGGSLEIEKLAPTFISLGIATAAVAEAWQYSQDRSQFGKRICGHQAVRHVLAEVQTKLKACRLMAYDAAAKVHNNLPSAVDTCMAKLYVTETAKEIVLACQQYVMGAYGYAEGFQMERYVRDILVGPIYGGSSAIQKNNIATLMKLPRE